MHVGGEQVLQDTPLDVEDVDPLSPQATGVETHSFSFGTEGAATGTDIEEDEESPQPEGPDPEAVRKFDARHAEAFDGLLFLGKLDRKFRFAGHEFVIRTINVDEVIAVGLLVKEHMDSVAWQKAYQTGVLAACIVTVDGHPLPEPLGEADDPLRARFDLVAKWYPSTQDFVYEQFELLEVEVQQVLEAMGNARG
jgi:hypothetical protein